MRKLFLALQLFIAPLAFCQSYNYPPYGYVTWQAPVASSAALPATGNLPGDARIDLTAFEIWIWNGIAWESGGGGTVTSVGLADGSTSPIYTISGSPVTGSGTLTFTLSTESANKVFAGPTTGSAAQPTFRSLVAADIPSLGTIYANVNLSNLSSTAVNASLVPGSAGSLALGSSTDYWASGYISLLGDSSNNASIDVFNRLFYDSSGVQQMAVTTTGLKLGTAGTTAGQITLESTGSATYSTAIQPAPSPSPNVVFQLPASNGTSGYLLTYGTPMTWSSPNPYTSPLPVPVPIADGGTNTATGVSGAVPNSSSTTASTWTVTPTLGVKGTTGGTITLASTGTATYATTIQPAPSPSPNITFQLPSTNGANGQVFQNTGSSATSWTASPQLGIGGTTAGSIILESTGSSTYSTTIQPAPSPSPNVVFELPAANGTAGYLLAYGTPMTWASPNPSGVSSFTGDGTVLNNSASTGAVTATLATHTANTILAGPSSGAAAAPTFRALVNADLSPGYKTPTVQNLVYNSGGSTFTGNRTSGSPTLASVSSFTGLYVGLAISGTGIPGSTYILALNSGASTLTMSANASSGSATSTTVTPSSTAGTYVLPSSPSPIYIRVVAVGGGGGGGGNNAGAGGTGTGGTATTFGTSLITCNGGSAGESDVGGGAGGTVTALGSGAIGLTVAGGSGNGSTVGPTSVNDAGGIGGTSALGGAGGGGFAGGGAGTAGAANTGSGGGGAGGSSTLFPGSGGGSGAYADAIITSPSATYGFTIGPGGAGGTGTSANGGAGGNGNVTVFEYYQ